jgi:hypothetical protein
MFSQTLFKSRRDILLERLPSMTVAQLLEMKRAYEIKLAFMDRYAPFMDAMINSYVLFLLVRSVTVVRLSSINRMLVTAAGCVLMSRAEEFREERVRLREEAGLLDFEVMRRSSLR